jgi:hypothetical protein
MAFVVSGTKFPFPGSSLPLLHGPNPNVYAFYTQLYCQGLEILSINHWGLKFTMQWIICVCVIIGMVPA